MKDKVKKTRKTKSSKNNIIKKLQKGGGPAPFVANFQITDSSIKKFRRWVQKPRDCVINAMELIGILDQQSADIARIFIGDTGAKIPQIEQVFSLVQQLYEWKFVKLNGLQDLIQITNNDAMLKKSHAMFCGYLGEDEGHVFLIAKGNGGKAYYIDPQVNEVCDLNQCGNYIANKQGYFVLQAKLK